MPPENNLQFNPTNNVPPVNPLEDAHQGKPKHLFLIILATLLILTGIFGVWYFSNPSPADNESEFVIPIKHDQFSDWKTYTNTEYGFEFKYPKEWSAYNSAYNDKNVLFGPEATNKSSDGGVQYVGDLEKGQSLPSFIKKFNEGVGGGSISETSSIINGQNVVISIMQIPYINESDIMESKDVSFSNNGKVFQVALNYHTNFTEYPSGKINLAVFDQILSTFKFISTSTPAK